MRLEALKRTVCAEVDRRAGLLIDVARQIHANPEVGHQEHFAHDLLTRVLEEAGLAVERKAYGMDTAFAARAGTEGPTVAVFCEYDALEDLGHACGHNVIAAAGLGAGIAAAAVAGPACGRLVVFGSPAEETAQAGKLLLAQRGALAGIDAALMVHPGPADLLSMDTLAVAIIGVAYTGLPAHAAAAPELGRNALDAAVLGYVNVAALRQHIAPDERVHGTFTDCGGRPNVVPAHAAASWIVRSPTLAGLDKLMLRVQACLEGGAAAAGCDLVFTEVVRAPEVATNGAVIERYAANMAGVGRHVLDPRIVGGVAGSTDMGVVSYLVPSIHPIIALSPPDVTIHQAEFAAHAASPAAHAAVLDAAKAMAMTVVDLWADGVTLALAQDEFAARHSPTSPPVPG